MSQKTTLRLPEDLLEEVRQLAQVKTKTEAIIIALSEFSRQKKLQKLMNAGGSIPLQHTWKKTRHAR